MTAALHGHDDVSTDSPASDLDVGLVSCVSGQVAARAKASVLRLRGLPFAASDSDVEGFFGGYDIVEVYICRRDGRSTGEAYVVFSTPEDVQKALVTLNKQYMGSRYIELFEAAEADLAAIKKVLEDSRLQGFVVRLRGLPYSATAADIKQFFSGVQLSEDDDAIVFAQSVDGRPTGEAYVELADERALSLAMTRHKELMGNRYIEIFNSSKVDKLQAVQQARFHMQSSQNRRSRWPMFPAAAATAGVHAGHVAGAAIPALPYGVLPSPDQLADTFGATQLNPAPVSSTATQGMQGPAPVVPFVLPVGTQMLQADARGMFHRAAAAAGRRASDATLSPIAAAAIPSVPHLRPLQMMAPQGAMMVGPDGQQLPPVYYMHPAQGMMWAGQPSTARAPMPMGMVPMVPVSGNPLMPNSPSDVAAPTAALGQSAPVWGSDVCQQQPGYQHAAPQAYVQQQIYQPTVGPQQYGSVPMPYVWPGPIPVGALPVSEPRLMPTSMATVGF